MDLYERLGTRHGAGSSEIRRAWQRLSRALHPALNPGDPVAAERYRDAAQAFEVLSDPQRRAAYDRGELPAVPVAPPAEGGFEGFDFSARVRIETVGFREIFDSAVRPAPGQRRRARGGPRAGHAPELRGVDGGRLAPRPPRALRALRGLPGRGRGGLRARALPALPGRRHGPRQPRAHDLLPPLRRLRRRRGDPPQGLRALRRRGARRSRASGSRSGSRPASGTAARSACRAPATRAAVAARPATSS